MDEIMKQAIEQAAEQLIEELHRRSLIPPLRIIQRRVTPYRGELYKDIASFGNDRPCVEIWRDDLLLDGQPTLWIGFGADDDPTLKKLLDDCRSEFPDPRRITSDQEWQEHFRNASEEVVGQPTVVAFGQYRGFGVYRRSGDVGLQAASDFIEQVLRSMPEYRVAEDADARKTSIWMMANQAEQTARNSNGQTVEHTVRARELRMPTKELVEHIEQLLIAQEDKCALTGISLQFHGAHDTNLIMSLDRIDSEGHYERENLQVVCRFINFWKSATPNDEFKGLLRLVIDAATTWKGRTI